MARSKAMYITSTSLTTSLSKWMKTGHLSLTHPPNLHPILRTPQSRTGNLDTQAPTEATALALYVPSEEEAKLLELRAALRASTHETRQVLQQEYKSIQAGEDTP
jgi:hypothetical protein